MIFEKYFLKQSEKLRKLQKKGKKKVKDSFDFYQKKLDLSNDNP